MLVFGPTRELAQLLTSNVKSYNSMLGGTKLQISQVCFYSHLAFKNENEMLPILCYKCLEIEFITISRAFFYISS